MSDQNFSEVDKLLSSDFDEPKKVETPKPETETEEKQPGSDMVVDEVKPTPEKKKVGRTPKKTTTPKKATPKKATPSKPSPKKVEKEIVTDPLKVSTRKSTKHSDWSELIYGSSEKFSEGDTLAVRAPKDSGDQFWLCALDGFGTEENNNKDDLEITWFEAKEGAAGVYVEGEEDDIAADSVICRTRLNASKDGTWVLPQVELKAIRDTLKLEREESSEIILEGDEKSDEASYKEGEEGDAKRRSKKEEKPKREPKSGDKRKAAVETNGEPKPKRAYKKREKKVPEAGGEGMAVESAKTETPTSEPPTTTATTTFPGNGASSISPSQPTATPTMPPMHTQPPTMAMQMPNHPMQHMYQHMHPMQLNYPGLMPMQMSNQMPMMQIPNHMAHYPVMQLPVQNPVQPPQAPTPTATEPVNHQPAESKTEAV